MVSIQSGDTTLLPSGARVIDASEARLPPGIWPRHVKLDGVILSRLSLGNAGASYTHCSTQLIILND